AVPTRRPGSISSSTAGDAGGLGLLPPPGAARLSRDAILAPWGPRPFRGPRGTSRPGRVPDARLTDPGDVTEYGRPSAHQNPRPGCCASTPAGTPRSPYASRSRGGPARSQVVFPVAWAVVPEVLAVLGLHGGDVLGRGPLDLVDP